MSQLPTGWVSAKLDSLGILHCGQSSSPREVNTTGRGTPYVTGPEQWDGHQIHRTKWTSHPRRVVPEGCIFITVKGAGVGTMFPGIACCIGRDVYAYEPHKEMDYHYVSYALQHTIDVVLRNARGDIPGLSRDHIVDHSIGVPPLKEQRRNVAKLKSLKVRSDRARQELDRVRDLIESYKRSVLRAAFKGDISKDWRKANSDTESVKSLLKRVSPPDQPRGGRQATDAVTPGVAGLSVNHPQTKTPKGWQWTPLLRLARQETGHTPSRSKPKYWDGNIPWIGIKDANIHHGKAILETLQTVSHKGLENSSARLLPEGTVCLSRTASVGYVTIMGRSMSTSQDFATWTCTPALLPKFLMYAFMAEGDDIRNFGEGSTHTTIYFPEIRALHICLPPIAEQEEIVQRVEKALAWIDKIAAEHARAMRLLPKLDQAILAKAFRGELVPQNPNDEPASELLARIKSEQTNRNQTRRRGRAPNA